MQRRSAYPISGAILVVLSTDAMTASLDELKRTSYENWKYVDIAVAAQDKKDTAGRYSKIADWTDLLPSDTEKSKVIQSGKRTGYSGTLYKDRYTNEIVYATRGSDGLPTSKEGAKDWFTADIPQALGFQTTQHNVIAPKIGESLSKTYGGNVTCVGYSLGGADSIIGCGAKGIPTKTFNSAGLNTDNNQYVIDSNNEREVDIDNFRFDTDAVSAFGELPGNTFTYDTPDGLNILDAHDIHRLHDEMQKYGTMYEQDMLSLNNDGHGIFNLFLGSPDKAPDLENRDIGLPDSEKLRIEQEEEEKRLREEEARDQLQRQQEQNSVGRPSGGGGSSYCDIPYDVYARKFPYGQAPVRYDCPNG